MTDIYKNLFQTDQMANDAALSELAPASTPLNTLFSNINARIKEPAMLTVNGTDLVLSVSNTVLTVGPNGRKLSLPPLFGIDLGNLSGNINLSTGTGTGDVQSITLPTMTAGYSIRFGVELHSDKKIYIIWGSEGNGTAGAPTFSAGALARGEIYLTDNGTGGQGHYTIPTQAAVTHYSIGGSGGGGGGGSTKNSGAIYVGTSTDVTNGYADYSVLQDAITFLVTGGKIVARDATYTGDISIPDNINIEGQGRKTVINGTVTFTGDYNAISNLKHGSIIFNAGADRNKVVNTWLANGSTITDNGTNNDLFYSAE